MQQSKVYKILVAEDEPDARELYIDTLSMAGYVVEGAEDGDQVEEMLSKNKYDIVLLDIIMPKKDGIQVLADIRSDKEKFGNPVVVMLSNIAGDVSVQKANELGADGYLLKSDVDPEQLVKVIPKYIT